jgi:hypothetical protein
VGECREVAGSGIYDIGMTGTEGGPQVATEP